MNLYETLGVSEDATPEEIKQAYHDKAKECHPDKADGDTEEMKDINHAYAILKSEKKRRQYDETGEDNDIDNSKAQIVNIVISIISQIINKNPENIPFAISQIRGSWSRDFQNGRSAVFSEIKKLETFKARILKAPDGAADIVTAVIDQNINSAKIRLKEIEVDYDNRLKAFTMIEQYTFSEIMEKHSDYFIDIGSVG